MPDYIYLLENRLSPEQQSALKKAVTAAKENGLTVFLSGGAVRDFTSGFPVRDLDISVQGNALTLRKPLEKAGAIVTGSDAASQTLFLRFPGVRVEVSATRTETFPKPGKVEYSPASMLDDLRRRDFTANAMALSLNDGSYGLLLDPLNGVADIESRLLRLTTNTGFIDDPSRLVRAARLMARYGWTMDDRTATRYKTAKEENYVKYISSMRRGYELEEIAHEEDPLRVLRHLEEEGWMEALFPALKAAVADEGRLEELRDTMHALQGQGINPDSSAANFEILTSKLPAADLTALKKLLPNPGFVEEWESLEADAREFAKALSGKDGNTPSTTWKLMTSYKPEAVLWLAMTGKAPSVQTKFKNFLTVWPEARQRIPYSIMQEMRITPDLTDYQDIQRKLFYMAMDDKLKTDEEIKAFLEPFSPPAPPPPVNVRRPRPKKAAEKTRSKKAAAPAKIDIIAAAEEMSPEDSIAEDSLPEDSLSDDLIPEDVNPDDPYAEGPATEEELDLVLGADISEELEADIEAAMEAKEVAAPHAAPAGVTEKNSAKATPPAPPSKPVKAAVEKAAEPVKVAAKKAPEAAKVEPAKVEAAKVEPARVTAAKSVAKAVPEKKEKQEAKPAVAKAPAEKAPGEKKAAVTDKTAAKPAPAKAVKDAPAAKAAPAKKDAEKAAEKKPVAKPAAKPASKAVPAKSAKSVPAKKVAGNVAAKVPAKAAAKAPEKRKR